MSDIKRCIYLYDTMAKRFAKTPLAPNQAKVYAEVRDYISTCKTVNEALEKVKNSKYYTMTTQALSLDKIRSYCLAAKDNGMPALEKIYEDKYKEIESDYLKAYDTGYTQKVAAEWIKENNTISAFCSIYTAYVELICCGFEPSEINEKQRRLKDAFASLRACNASFEDLCANDHYRRLIPANDHGFNKFKSEAPIFANAAPDRHAYKEEFDSEFSRIWADITANKAQVLAAGGNSSSVRKGACVAIPPKDKNGKYEFTLREEE